MYPGKQIRRLGKQRKLMAVHQYTRSQTRRSRIRSLLSCCLYLCLDILATTLPTRWLLSEVIIGLVPKFLRMGFHDCIGGCDGTLETWCDSPQNQNGVTIKSPLLNLASIVLHLLQEIWQTLVTMGWTALLLQRRIPSWKGLPTTGPVSLAPTFTPWRR
jgi:hypothetical protein